MSQISDAADAQLRHQAVILFRAGLPVPDIAATLHRSRRWVYQWVAFQHQHPHTHFHATSRAPRHHPNRISAQMVYRIIRLRHTLQRQRRPIGARTIHHTLEERHLRPCPSPSTIQRVLQRQGLTQGAMETQAAYRPHPLAAYPNAVQATDIVTRWLKGGAVVQTFTTVDHFTNAAYATSYAHKDWPATRAHLLKTWEILGLPDLSQFDNESAFSGGRYAAHLSPLIRLCLYMGSEVVFTPEYEADYNWQVETFNNFWAHQFWNKHRFTHRGYIPRAQRHFLQWYDTQYVAPRLTGTPRQLRRGAVLYLLSRRLAKQIPDALPICKGLVHAIRRVAADGYVKFLQQPYRVGKRYHGKYVWLTLETAQQTLTVWYQVQAQADWVNLRTFPYALDEPVRPVPKEFRRLHR